jgi:hypothetical protein
MFGVKNFAAVINPPQVRFLLLNVYPHLLEEDVSILFCIFIVMYPGCWSDREENNT